MPKGTYRIFETDRFGRDLAALARPVHAAIRRKLQEYVYLQLQVEPHFGPNRKRLKHWDPPTWRYRIGDWRFFYEIDERTRIVSLTAADHRREAYR